MGKINIFLFLILVLVSCEKNFTTTKEIDIPEHEPKLVVFASLQDSVASVYIGQSTAILDDDIHKPVNAIFTITENDIEIIQDTFIGSNEIEKIDFKMNKNISVGEEYTIVVKSDEFETVTSMQKAVKTAEIVNIKYFKRGAVNLLGNAVDKVNFELVDIANEDNYYIVKIEKVLGGGKTQGLNITSSDPSLKRVFFEDYACVVFLDRDYDGVNRQISIDLFSAFENPQFKLQVKLVSITREAYDFFISKSQYEESEFNPFSEPVVVTNNLENGYGLFAVYTHKDFVFDPK